jgi:hypothetical protein
MPCHAPAIICLGSFESIFSRPQHNMAWHGICEWTYAISWWPVGDLPKFSFFWLPCGHSQKSLIRMLPPFDCFPSTEWWWRKIIQQNTFWWTNLRVQASLSSLVMLCLHHAFFSLSVYKNCLNFSDFKILILKSFKNFCLSSFRHSNRA